MEQFTSWSSGFVENYGNIALENVIVFAPKLILAIIVLWVGIGVSGKVHKKVLLSTTQSKRVDTTLGNFFASIIRYGMLIATLLLAVSIVGVDVAKIFTIFAAMTLAIGLALQGTMSNVAAGILLIIFRPYRVGEYVEVNGEEGHVEEMNVFTTTLRTLDNVKLILANGDCLGSTIKNYSSLGLRRVDVTFGIDYDDDMDLAMKIIKETAALHPDIVARKDHPWAKVSNLGDSSVDIEMRVWCKPENYWDVMYDLTKSVKEAFDAGGISIPYPHQVEIIK